MDLNNFKKPDTVLILPYTWAQIAAPAETQRAYVNSKDLLVLVGWEKHDGNWWLHASCSYRDHLPDWNDLREVKDIFIGRNRKAIQVLPPEKEYINKHPFVLHLWSCVDKDPLPDFRKIFGGKGI